jgi:uncharacterized protein YjbI with pentapeptide repeats
VTQICTAVQARTHHVHATARPTQQYENNLSRIRHMPSDRRADEGDKRLRAAVSLAAVDTALAGLAAASLAAASLAAASLAAASLASASLTSAAAFTAAVLLAAASLAAASLTASSLASASLAAASLAAASLAELGQGPGRGCGLSLLPLSVCQELCLSGEKKSRKNP